jgi:inner membrane protein
MDSLTQIVLGAAVGEVCLGKKIGNRAMLWGAIGGTIPDLDVLANGFLGEAEALAFHRGISHSIFFAVVMSFVIAWLIHKLYETKKGYLLEGGLAILFHTMISAIICFIIYTIAGPIGAFIGILFAIFFYIYGLHKLWKDYFFVRVVDKPSLREWQFMMFMALITHPLLDCFTSYGTQLFAPFSNYRVAFNNISVADPAYTLPFLICLIIVSFIYRTIRLRRIIISIGFVLSSVYMLFTLVNMQRVKKVMSNTLAEQNISYKKSRVSPSILSNVLWTGAAETDSFFFQGLYSQFDKKKNFKLTPIPKNHQLIADAKEDDKTINILKWFSDGYYTVLRRSDGKLQFNDMRFGTFNGVDYGEDDYVFRFTLEKQEDGYYRMLDSKGGPKRGSEDQMASQLWVRIKGI